MVGYYYKTGAEIYSILRFMKNSLNLPYKPSASSIEVAKMYTDKKYHFSFFLNVQKEIIYLIEQLGDDTTDYFEEKKKMTIYDYADYVSNPLTAINTMIMIGNLKESFGDKLHETACKGYLTMPDVIPYKYYKLYLWYWCDDCYYGIRECTEENFNIKEDKEMTKEEALKKIEELKEYVEKCEEKEKEIPEMPYDVNSTHRICLEHPSYGAWQECGRFQFKSLDTRECYRIKAFELAHLMYAREHLEIKTEYICKYRLYFDSDRLKYDVIEFDRHNNYSSNGVFESINHWLFPDEDSARKVANYMNKYVKDKVKELY